MITSSTSRWLTSRAGSRRRKAWRSCIWRTTACTAPSQLAWRCRRASHSCGCPTTACLVRMGFSCNPGFGGTPRAAALRHLFNPQHSLAVCAYWHARCRFAATHLLAGLASRAALGPSVLRSLGVPCAVCHETAACLHASGINAQIARAACVSQLRPPPFRRTTSPAACPPSGHCLPP